jgi:hypothetical protein
VKIGVAAAVAPSFVGATSHPCFVVGWRGLDPHTTVELNDVLPDETAVRIPAETMVRAIEKYLAECPRA